MTQQRLTTSTQSVTLDLDLRSMIKQNMFPSLGLHFTKHLINKTVAEAIIPAPPELRVGDSSFSTPPSDPRVFHPITIGNGVVLLVRSNLTHSPNMA